MGLRLVTLLLLVLLPAWGRAAEVTDKPLYAPNK